MNKKVEDFLSEFYSIRKQREEYKSMRKNVEKKIQDKVILYLILVKRNNLKG